MIEKANINKVIITKSQLESIQKIMEKFDNVDQIEIIEESKNGIGPTTTVKINIKLSKHEYDITDVTNW